MNQSIQQLVAYAQWQLEQGNLQESEESFRRVLTSGQYTAQGLYGLGVIRRKQGNLADARQYLQQSLQQDPSHIDAYYQLGRIAQQEQSWEEARSYFNRALAMNPQYEKARQALAQQPGGSYPASAYAAPAANPGPPSFANDDYNMPTVAVAPQILPIQPAPPPALPPQQAIYAPAPLASVTPPPQPAIVDSFSPPQQYGAFDHLRDQQSRLAQNTLALIDALRIKKRPSTSAYLSDFIPMIIGICFLVAFLLCLASYLSGAAPQFMLIVTIVLGLFSLWGLYTIIRGIFHYLHIKSIEYTIDQGRIQIRRGIFSRDITSYDLFHIREIELRQSFLNRLTQDGTLIFTIENEASPLIIKGLLKGAQLDKTYQNFLTLVSLLRQNPSLKGFIS